MFVWVPGPRVYLPVVSVLVTQGFRTKVMIPNTYVENEVFRES
jgi:hypothetical protein